MLASPLVMQFQRKAVQESGEKAQWEAALDKAKEVFEEKKTWFTDHAQPSNLIPPVGVEVMSYGRLLQQLQAKQVSSIWDLKELLTAALHCFNKVFSLNFTA